jgi:hypothetical protein
MNYQNSGIVTIQVDREFTTPGGVELAAGSLAKIPASEWDEISPEDAAEYGIRQVGAMGLREDIKEVSPGVSVPSSDVLDRAANDPTSVNTTGALGGVEGESGPPSRAA